MKKIIYSLLLVMALSWPGLARAVDMKTWCNVLKFDIGTFPVLVQSDARQSGPYVYSYCDAAGRGLPQLYGDLSMQMQHKAIIGDRGVQVSQDVSYKNLCGNYFTNLARMDAQDISTFVLILGSVIAPSQDIDENASQEAADDIKFWLDPLQMDNGEILINTIAKFIAQRENDPQHKFWYKLKNNMLLAFMKGQDITRYTRSKFGQNLYFMAQYWPTCNGH